MKFLLKVAIVAAAAKFVLATPDNRQPRSNRTPSVTTREITRKVDNLLMHAEKAIRNIRS